MMDNETATVRNQFAGREFRCRDTGNYLVVPNDVRPRDYLAISEFAGVDVGDGLYSRYIGPVAEVERVSIRLTEENARRLQAIMQNPLSGDKNPFNEDPDDYAMREQIFERLEYQFTDKQQDKNGRHNTRIH